MDKGIRPIPALYACYLLRSTVRHGSLYVGSTPDPVRRLKQHNGVSKGGAMRTSKDSLRPWEVTCLVTGFPSKIAALQFEWAWQNTHLTRHIAAETRITQAKAKVRISPRSGRVRKRVARPRLSLTDRIANLHLLLQACSFERWPLRLTFYVQDVYKMWQRWTARHPDPIPTHVGVLLDASTTVSEPASDHQTKEANGLASLQIDYSSVKGHLEKSRSILLDGRNTPCTICNETMPADGAGVLLCPGTDCSMAAHLTCMSKTFLQAQPTALVPTDGQCPKCSKPLIWVELVRELSLRMRGEAEIAKLSKPARVSKTKKKQDLAQDAAAVIKEDEEGQEEDDDIWHILSESDEEMDEPVTPNKPIARASSTRQQFMTDEQIIEDSDWDDAEVLT